jgi:diadenosine tetraphosphatase ApaH/serine/threonine PP2A family protein phosphatase
VLGLIYDVHGNLAALEAVLAEADAAGADRYLLGGDYALFGAWPAETVERLRALDARWIRGNVDRWTATEAPDGEPAKSGVERARGILDPVTVQELGALPESADLGHSTRAWHASPKTDLASLWPEPGEDERDLLEGVTDRRIVFGHFHVSFERVGAYEIELVAPGSVGMPVDGDHRAAWALMHDDGRIERRRVAYDHAASAARVREVAGGAPWGDVVAARIERAAMG